MNLLGRLLPMWVLNTCLLSAIIDARSEPDVSSNSEPVFVTERQPISQFSLKMQAESPGISTMQRIFCFLWTSMFCSLFASMGLHWLKIQNSKF